MNAVDGERFKRKRVFIVKASRAYIDCSLRGRALASYGRLDVVARAAIAALITRRGVRRDVIFCAVLEGQKPAPLLLEIDGEKLHSRFESEADFGELLRRVYCGERESGVDLYESSFAELVRTVVNVLGKEAVYYLHEDGVDITGLRVAPHSAFILGDHLGVDPETERWLRRELGLRWVSIGPLPYFTEHCITFVQALLDGAL